MRLNNFELLYHLNVLDVCPYVMVILIHPVRTLLRWKIARYICPPRPQGHTHNGFSYLPLGRFAPFVGCCTSPPSPPGAYPTFLTCLALRFAPFTGIFFYPSWHVPEGTLFIVLFHNDNVSLLPLFHRIFYWFFHYYPLLNVYIEFSYYIQSSN